MDRLTIAGIFLAVFAIFGGQILDGGSINALINPAAFLIVVGGSFGAVMIQTHLKTFVRAMKITKWVFSPPVQPMAEGIKKVTAWSHLARREGLLGLEKSIDKNIDPYILKGLNMLVDGNDPDAIRAAMYVELDVTAKDLLKASKVYESLGGYSPTIGIVGAVLGLIHVMSNLGEPELLGAGIATAIYGNDVGRGGKHCRR
ncbi:MAG: flagellar motor protein [Kangiellaceae bacterium]|nr:flagellar motor protein [Kangiellaceae bacterium]